MAGFLRKPFRGDRRRYSRNRAFDLTMIAEGVESAAVADALADKGCDYAQGYHIARPLPPDDVPALIRA
jgi:EAL domain-containing protein (putative c-di-GMP-specific phosphodiesterase class I)